jgi:hypothetical protein
LRSILGCSPGTRGAAESRAIRPER